MRRVLSILLVLAAAAPFPAPAAATVWLCGLSEDLVRLVCIADTGPQSPEAAPEAAATVNGVQFPLDPRRTYVVDLWSPPTEVAFVEQLARATICYRSPGCEVLLISPLPAPAASDGRQRRSR